MALQIFVKRGTGRIIASDVEPNDMDTKCKAKIQHKEGIHGNQQRLNLQYGL